MSSTNWGSQLEDHGFAVGEERLPADLVDALSEETDRLFAESTSRGGARNLLHRSKVLTREGEHGFSSEIAKHVLGPGARATKLTLFNKTPEANWPIRWHQDSAIAVREKNDAPGFSGWSVKDGVPHVRPPASVLEGILALRIHFEYSARDLPAGLQWA